ncbi:MAG TPA: hypothetical protein PL059_05175, partial [Spirochaetota bacterium]|nr:hypothetical protein [Spirochaetota bacterium]
VQIVGLANLFAKIIENENLSENDRELLNAFSKALGITQEDYNYLTGEIINTLQNDELYKMSTSLIG